jgi:hypothetical protein
MEPAPRLRPRGHVAKNGQHLLEKKLPFLENETSEAPFFSPSIDDDDEEEWRGEPGKALALDRQ